MIVGLMGKKQSGKDTSAALLVEKLGFKRIAFADALKDLTGLILDVDPKRFVHTEAFKTRSYDGRLGREWLQTIGVACRDVLGKDIWVNVVRARIEDEPVTNWVVTDVRFQNEFAALSQIHLRPNTLWARARFIRTARADGRTDGDTHVSETDLDNVRPDLLVTTDSADATAQAVLTAVEGWLGGSR